MNASSVDRNGALHDGRGRFDGHLLSEGDPALLTSDPDPFSNDHGLEPGPLLDALWTASRRIMDQHGLADWKLAYGNARHSTLGSTSHGSKLIVLSAPLMVQVRGPERLDTLMHEIAHAQLPASEGHGIRWQVKAMQLGARPAARSHLDATPEDKPVVGTCPSGHEFYRSRRPDKKRIHGWRCSNPAHRGCSLAEVEITWTRREVAQLHPQISAAINRYSEAKPKLTLRVGDTATIHSTGTQYDGMSATIEQVGRTNYIVRMPGVLRCIRIPGSYLH